MKTADEATVHGSLSNSFSANTQWDASLTYGSDALGGSRFETKVGVELRPSPRWQFSIEPSYSRTEQTRQYITQRAGGRPEVFGGRYVFGRIDRHTLSAQVRLSYAFTPKLTLELYAEPFAGSGQYDAIGELRAARTSDLRRYGTDGTTLTRDEANGTITVQDGADTFTFRDPDFHVLSFRSNAVLRWEWHPGSTLYLVWQQNRDDSGDPRRATGPGFLLDSFGRRGDNFVALKVSYLFQVR